MKTMERMGKNIAKRPWACIGVVLLITIGAFASIAMNGVSFELDEDEMAPQTDAYEADQLLQDVFNNQMSSISLLRGEDVLSKDMFIAAIEYERNIFNDEVANDYLISPNVSSVNFQSPYSALMSAMTDGSNNYTLYLSTLDAMTEAQLKQNVSAFLAMENFQPLHGLFTEDLDVPNATAKGAMIMTVLNRTLIMENEDLDMLSFENRVSGIADNVTNAHLADDGSIQLFGENTIIQEMGDIAESELGTLFPLALFLMVVILLFMYRDLVDMAVAIACLIFAIIWTFGAAPLFGIGTSTIAIAVPILVLGLGIDYALHLVYRYRDERGNGTPNDEASANAVGSVGEALLLATITTVIAFLSNITSSMNMLADFGRLSAIGIVASFIVMILVVPSVQSIRDKRASSKGVQSHEVKRYSRRSVKENDTIGKVAMIGGRLAIKKPLAVLLAGALVLGGFGYAATNVSYEFDVFDFLPPESEANKMLTFIFNEFPESGQFNAEILVYGNATDPDVIRAIESSVENMDSVENLATDSEGVAAMHIGSVLFENYTESENPTFKALYASYFNTTDGGILEHTTQENVSQVLGMLLAIGDYETKLKLSGVIGETPDGEPVTRIQVPLTKNLNEAEALELKNDLDSAIVPLNEAGYEAVPTGQVITNAMIMNEMENDQMTSLFITLVSTLVILTIAMFWLTRSYILGALATLPTVMSVVMVWGSMYLLDISLNVMTLTIAALTVGMGVTYGIHIVHRFADEMKRGLTPEEAIMVTTGATGRGVIGAALTTAVGFGVLGFSAMPPMAQFGLITAMAIAYAYIGATIALPSLLLLWGRRTQQRA